jgi:hypothetical protein
MNIPVAPELSSADVDTVASEVVDLSKIEMFIEQGVFPAIFHVSVSFIFLLLFLCVTLITFLVLASFMGSHSVFMYGYLHFSEALTGEKDKLPSQGATFTDWFLKNPLPEVFLLQWGSRSQRVGLRPLGISCGGRLGREGERSAVALQNPSPL